MAHADSQIEVKYGCCLPAGCRRSVSTAHFREADSRSSSANIPTIVHALDRGLGLYIHIPFCKKRCPYCDFNTVARAAPDWDSLADCLLRELAYWQATFSYHQIKTIYFGGGTPSLAPPRFFSRILDRVAGLFSLSQCLEVTVEVNPSSTTLRDLQNLRRDGVNRLSIGWQSGDDHTLLALGRSHSVNQGRDAVAKARAAGFDNISIDIIFGVPGQGLLALEQDLERIVSLAPKHISAYELTIHPDTPFGRAQQRGELHLPHEELATDMITVLAERLETAGFCRYEVSNFALPGFESRHNRAYWTGRRYLGIGPGAHSFNQTSGCDLTARQRGQRWEAIRSVARYMDRWRGKKPVAGESSVQWQEDLDAAVMRRERLMCGLRCAAGVRLNKIASGDEYIRLWAITAQANDRGWVTIDGNCVAPTRRGMLHADKLAELFF